MSEASERETVPRWSRQAAGAGPNRRSKIKKWLEEKNIKIGKWNEIKHSQLVASFFVVCIVAFVSPFFFPSSLIYNAGANVVEIDGSVSRVGSDVRRGK